MRRTEDIEYVNELKPDFVGFILSPGFRRSIDFDTFKSLRGNLSNDISAIGVFVNEPLESIEKFTDSGLIDFVQLHGGESPQYAEQITLPVIKALKPCDFDKINEYKHCVDYLLFDSGTGTGKAFDWQKNTENGYAVFSCRRTYNTKYSFGACKILPRCGRLVIIGRNKRR